MELMNVFECRKSVRAFTGEPASEAAMQKILHAANASPVGMGRYDSLHLTLVTDKAILSEIEAATAAAFHTEKRSFLYNAPELLMVSTSSCDNVGYSNAAIVAQDAALAAVDANVGACLIWGCIAALSAAPELVKKLAVPDGFVPVCAVALGQAKEPYQTREIPENRIALTRI